MLTQDRNTPYRDTEIHPVPVAADDLIFAGAIVMLDANGFATRGHTATGLTYVGRAQNSADNRDGMDGDMYVNVRRNKAFKWKNSSADPIGQSGLFKPAYVEDDETLAATDGTGTRSAAGIVVGIDPDGIWLAN